MGLLENGAHVDHGVDVGAARGVAADRRRGRRIEEIAQGAHGRAGRGTLGRSEREQAPATVGLHSVAEMNALRIPVADDRRRMEAHPLHEAGREVLVGGLGDDEVRPVVRGHARRVPEFLREVALELGGIDAAGVGIRGVLGRRAEHARPLVIVVDQILRAGPAFGRIRLEQTPRRCAA